MFTRGLGSQLVAAACFYVELSRRRLLYSAARIMALLSRRHRREEEAPALTLA